MKMLTLGLSCTLFLAACGPVEAPPEELESTSGALSSKDFDVDFTGCREFVGIGAVPLANARPLVPAAYVLAGDATSATIVVRVSDCSGVAVDGKKPAAGRAAQIGLSVTKTDSDADIDNYTLWYATNLGVLHGKLTSAGVDADLDNGIRFQFSPNSCTSGNLSVGASPPHGPAFSACGTASTPTESPIQFIATWWQDTGHGTVAMRTIFPAIRFGTTNATLTTPAGSALAALIGGTTLSFVYLDSFNTFPSGHMTVRQP